MSIIFFYVASIKSMDSTQFRFIAIEKKKKNKCLQNSNSSYNVELYAFNTSTVIRVYWTDIELCWYTRHIPSGWWC